MHDNCIPGDCPVLPRVEALEEANRQHSATHREMFKRLADLETATAVQDTKLDTIEDKLDDLTAMVKELSGKAGKRWEKAVETVLVTIVTGVVCFLLGRMGL